MGTPVPAEYRGIRVDKLKRSIDVLTWLIDEEIKDRKALAFLRELREELHISLSFLEGIWREGAQEE